MNKCSFGDGISIKPDGKNEIDPCIYEDIEMWHNVTVVVSKCIHCGHVEISWMRQDNTEGGAVGGRNQMDQDNN